MIGLDDEVKVVVLDGELQDAEARAGRRNKRAAHGGKDAIRSEAGERSAEGDMHRMGCCVFGTAAVGHSRPATGRPLSSCAGPASTPSGWGRKRQLHRESAHDLA